MPLDPEKIRARRLKLGITQEQAAALAGIAQSNWARIETGVRCDPKLSTAQRVAHALRCKVDALLSRD